MTPSIDQTLHQYANLLPNWTLLPILTLIPNFGGFHRTVQRVRLANRGRLLLPTPDPVPFETYICSNVETILSWTCHVYGPFEFWTSLGTSILLTSNQTLRYWHRRTNKNAIWTNKNSISYNGQVSDFVLQSGQQMTGIFIIPVHCPYQTAQLTATLPLSCGKVAANNLVHQKREMQFAAIRHYWYTCGELIAKSSPHYYWFAKSSPECNYSPKVHHKSDCSPKVHHK